jgi:hypothetical protein
MGCNLFRKLIDACQPDSNLCESASFNCMIVVLRKTQKQLSIIIAPLGAHIEHI